jgi:hypothetical protein
MTMAKLSNEELQTIMDWANDHGEFPEKKTRERFNQLYLEILRQQTEIIQMDDGWKKDVDNLKEMVLTRDNTIKTLTADLHKAQGNADGIQEYYDALMELMKALWDIEQIRTIARVELSYHAYEGIEKIIKDYATIPVNNLMPPMVDDKTHITQKKYIESLERQNKQLCKSEAEKDQEIKRLKELAESCCGGCEDESGHRANE